MLRSKVLIRSHIVLFTVILCILTHISFISSSKADTAPEKFALEEITADKDAGFWCVDEIAACEEAIATGRLETLHRGFSAELQLPTTNVVESLELKDGDTRSRWLWVLQPTDHNYSYCTRRGCTYWGTVRFSARVNLGGRGTRNLVSAMEVVRGPAILTKFKIACAELPFAPGHCGNREWSLGYYRKSYVSHDFAKAGDGYKFRDAANYRLFFEWDWDPETGPPGWVSNLRRYSSAIFKCPPRNRECYFP